MIVTGKKNRNPKTDNSEASDSIDITFRIRQHPRSQSADIDESVCLSCLSEESDRHVTYQWYKEKELLRNELASELNLIVDEHDYGEYSCRLLARGEQVLHSKPALIWRKNVHTLIFSFFY